jgi:hypothetical protein
MDFNDTVKEVNRESTARLRDTRNGIVPIKTAKQ